jgi:hypothetical protein
MGSGALYTHPVLAPDDFQPCQAKAHLVIKVRFYATPPFSGLAVNTEWVIEHSCSAKRRDNYSDSQPSYCRSRFRRRTHGNRPARQSLRHGNNHKTHRDDHVPGRKLAFDQLTGFSGQVTFACESLPANASCGFNPETVTLTSGPASVSTVPTMLSVHTSASTTSQLQAGRAAYGLAFAGLLLFWPGRRSRNRILAILLCAIVRHVGAERLRQRQWRGPSCTNRRGAPITLPSPRAQETCCRLKPPIPSWSSSQPTSHSLCRVVCLDQGA